MLESLFAITIDDNILNSVIHPGSSDTTKHIYSLQNLFSLLNIINYTLRKKKVQKSCHWSCTFTKGKLLAILGANKYILGANM